MIREDETDPASTPNSELKNTIGITQVEHHDLPAHKQEDLSVPGYLNDVIPLLSALKA